MKKLIEDIFGGVQEVEEIDPDYGRLSLEGEVAFDDLVKKIYPPGKKKLSYRLQKKKKLENNIKYLKSLNKLRRK